MCVWHEITTWGFATLQSALLTLHNPTDSMMDGGDSLLVSIKTYCRDSDQVFQSLLSPPVEGGGELEVEHGASSLTIKILIEVQFGLRAILPARSREGWRDEAREDLVTKAAPACAGAPVRMQH